MLFIHNYKFNHVDDDFLAFGITSNRAKLIVLFVRFASNLLLPVIFKALKLCGYVYKPKLIVTFLKVVSAESRARKPEGTSPG